MKRKMTTMKMMMRAARVIRARRKADVSLWLESPSDWARAEGTKVQRGGPVASLKSWVSRCRESLERERRKRERETVHREWTGVWVQLGDIWSLGLLLNKFVFHIFNLFFVKFPYESW